MEQKKNLKINNTRFEEEIERIKRYLTMISERRMSRYECISILEDLGVIEDRGSLEYQEIIDELSNHLLK